jgi:glucose/mannose-6-phosphate isomerase
MKDIFFNLELDKSRMRQILIDFHQQVRKTNSKISNIPLIKDSHKINKILILGMGGSAISGDLVRSFIEANHPEIDIPIMVSRNYYPPKWIDSNTMVIAVSYSGNTEETLSALEISAKTTNHILGITSGGSLQEICKQKNYQIIEVPAGFQPRAALGYLFFNILNYIISNFCKVCTISKTVIEEQILADFLENKAKTYQEIDENNIAIKLATKLFNKQVIIYSSNDLLDVVNLRWRGQIQENAKNLAFGNLLPEMNHNEINSWVFPKIAIENSAIIFLRDKNDNPKILTRILATSELLSSICPTTEIIESAEDNPITRLFDLIYLADWVSFYLALLNNQDPTPIPLISKLKEIMSNQANK